MQGKIEEMHKNMTHIQNTIWSAYKEFLADQDMKAYTRKMAELVKEYQDSGNLLLASFAENEAITWCPVINGFAEEFGKEGKMENELC